MSFPLCRRCKTSVNPQRYSRCIGCGATLENLLPPSRRVRPRVLVEGTKDAGRATGVLSLIGVLGMLVFFGAFGSGNGYGMILTGAAAVTGTVSWIVRIARKFKGDTAGQALLRVLAILLLCGVALFFGLGILLGITCIGSSGGFH